MAKSDSFFIRKTVNIDNTNGFFQGTIDCGAYVDALGMSVLRLHQLSTQYTFGAAFGPPSVAGAGQEAGAFWQLTTQSQGSLVDASNKSVVSSGSFQSTNATANANSYSFSTETTDINPQDWTNGYLIGVEQIYLGAQATDFQ